MPYLSPEPHSASKPKLLGTLDTNTDIICHNYISGIYPTCRDQVRIAIRTKHYSLRTEEAYANWMMWFILFHNKRHPAEMGAREIKEFLSHLAVKERVAASTQNQALNAILFLYREVLHMDIEDLSDGIVWAKKPKRVPEVLTPDEANAVLSQLEGVYWFMGMLMYGAGLRLIECLRIAINEAELRNRVKQAGAKWNPEKQISKYRNN